jgi:hypothetical protein
MALRLILLSLVALFSLELPTSRDVAAWSRNGNQWVGDRLADAAQWMTAIGQTCTGVSPTELANEPTATVDPIVEEITTMRADLSFEAAIDGFVTDLRSGLDSSATVVVQATADLTVEVAEPVCFERGPATDESSSVAPAVELSPGPDRLTSAVRLTREALSAWASLLPQSTDRETEIETEDSR